MLTCLCNPVLKHEDISFSQALTGVGDTSWKDITSLLTKCTPENFAFLIIINAWPEQTWASGAVVGISQFNNNDNSIQVALSTNSPQNYGINLRVFYYSKLGGS